MAVIEEHPLLCLVAMDDEGNDEDDHLGVSDPNKSSIVLPINPLIVDKVTINNDAGTLHHLIIVCLFENKIIMTLQLLGHSVASG